MGTDPCVPVSTEAMKYGDSSPRITYLPFGNMVFQDVIKHLGQAVLVRTYNPSNIIEGVQFMNVVVDVSLAGWKQVILGDFSVADPAEHRIKVS
jgi:hypothetical protein